MLPYPRARLACALLGALALSGCGTYHLRADGDALQNDARPDAWNGRIALTSDPAGARCAVTRAGAAVVDVTTPGQVSLPRGNEPAEVRCTAPGRMETLVTLRPLRDFGVHHHQPTGPFGATNNREDIRTGRVRRFFDTNVAIATHFGHRPDEKFIADYRALFDQRDLPYEASMLRDIERGGPVEADQILGDMLTKCREAGQPDLLHLVAFTHLKAYESRRAAGRLPG